MASYALLGALSGFRYSAAEKTLWFGPKLTARPFRTFFSSASGFGTIALDSRSIRVEVLEGQLIMEKLVLTQGATTHVLHWEATAHPGTPAIRELV